VKGSLTEGIGEFDSKNSILSTLKQCLAEWQQVTLSLLPHSLLPDSFFAKLK
jgi:hypothetical protein